MDNAGSVRIVVCSDRRFGRRKCGVVWVKYCQSYRSPQSSIELNPTSELPNPQPDGQYEHQHTTIVSIEPPCTRFSFARGVSHPITYTPVASPYQQVCSKLRPKRGLLGENSPTKMSRKTWIDKHAESTNWTPVLWNIRVVIWVRVAPRFVCHTQ